MYSRASSTGCGAKSSSVPATLTRVSRLSRLCRVAGQAARQQWQLWVGHHTEAAQLHQEQRQCWG